MEAIWPPGDAQVSIQVFGFCFKQAPPWDQLTSSLPGSHTPSSLFTILVSAVARRDHGVDEGMGEQVNSGDGK